jgi:hypothetical protein
MVNPVRPPPPRWTASAAACVLLLLAARTARADDVADEATALRLPVAFAERPLTTPQYVLAGSLDVSYAQAPEITDVFTYVVTPSGAAGFVEEAVPGTLRTLEASPGASFGITSDVELHARPLPVVYTPAATSFHLAGASIGATYRFVRGPVVEVGVGGDVVLYTQGDGGFEQTAALPVRLHLGRVVRVDTGPVFALFAGSETTSVSVSVPLRVAVQLAPTVYLGATTGLQRQLVRDDASEETVSPSLAQTLTFPLGFFAGATVPGPHGPILDVRPYFTWSTFLTPDAPASTHTDTFVAGVIATGFLYF